MQSDHTECFSVTVLQFNISLSTHLLRNPNFLFGEAVLLITLHATSS